MSVLLSLCEGNPQVIGGFPAQRDSNAGDVSFWRRHNVPLWRALQILLPWLYQSSMMTSSNGNIFRVTGHSCGEFTGPGEFPLQRPVTRSFDVFFDLRPNKRLSKQSWGWWFETLSCSLWRHRNKMPNIILSELHTQRNLKQPQMWQTNELIHWANDLTVADILWNGLQRTI